MPNKIRIITRDQIRTLVPHQQPTASGKADTDIIVLPAATAQSVRTDAAPSSLLLQQASEHIDKKSARSVSPEQAQVVAQIHSQQRALANEQEREEQVRRDRKERMAMFDRQRQSHELSDIQRSQRDEANALLAKARMQKDEEEDEIKKLNEMMLEAKCMTVRDGQLLEKRKISAALKEDELRLDRMMEADRLSGISRTEQVARQRKEEQRQGAAVIRTQIDERREMNLLEQEKKDAETRQMLQQIKEMQEQDLSEKKKKLAEQHVMMEKILEANRVSIEKKKIDKQASYDEDKRLLQYRLDQDAIAEQKEKDAEKRIAEREKELSRLRSMQQRAVDKQAQQDALRAERAFESYEREWRRKEKENARKKATMENQLQTERIRQQADREHAIAVEAFKIRQSFEESLARSRQEEQKLQEQQRTKHSLNRAYAHEVQGQIAQKRAEVRKAREEFFFEGVKQQKEIKERDAHILEIKERKLQTLRDMAVPDIYTSEIQRKMGEAARREARITNTKVNPPYATMGVSAFEKPITSLN